MSGAAAHPIKAPRLGGLAARLPLWSLVAGLVISVLAVGLAIGIPLGGTDTVLSRIAVVSFVVGMTALAMSGAALLQQDAAHPMGWWLITAGLAGLVSTLVAGGAVVGVRNGADVPIAFAWSSNWVWIPAQFAVLELLLRFPTGRLPSRAWHAVEVLLVGWSVWAITVTALLPGPLGSDPLAHLNNPFGWVAASEFLNLALAPTFLAIPVLTVLCASAMLWRWFRSPAAERQQLKWILAAALFLAIVTPFASLGDVMQLAEAAGYLLLPAALIVAVLQADLWELGRVVRRSLVYAGATAVLAGCYLIIVLALDGATTPVIAAVVVAALALPVKNFFHRLLERILFGERGDPARAVAKLSESLHRESPSLAQTVVTQLADSLRLPFVALEDADGVQLAASGTPGTEAARLPLLVNGVETGWLVAHERASGEGLDAKDRRLLAMVATQAGLAVRTESLTADLRSSFARLATVREEERARLQRDLHDELGPSLAGIVLQSEAARNLARNPANGAAANSTGQLDAVLASIGANAETLVQDVRRIIDGLRPASLDSTGLGSAIKEAAGRVASDVPCELDVPDHLPGLPSEVEVAVFRVTLEAVLNATRHAAAGRIRARIVQSGATVVVTVEDDGIGMRGAEPGIGMRSMRERVESVGGELLVGPGEHGRGSSVVARIPVGTA
ncbi:sensor histidine kinase [Salinibacterium sp. ZJ450]|uniref:sensor histidine kinase n=1 Tax=Salinibacterium sp. ZJ450 TaxID=2708338 RepID=UPI001421741F|nr:sensor histidine kinase [Salinibacterium sp. ZJ450]